MPYKIRVNSLPFDGGDPITDIEVELDDNSVVTLGATVPGDYDIAASYGDQLKIRARNVNGAVPWANVAAKSAPGVAPTVTSNVSLSGRTVTISTSNVSGVPAPSTSLAALNSNAVSVLGDQTGTGPWEYVVPSSASEQVISGSVSATNAESTASDGFSIAVPADLFAPAALTQPTLTDTNVGQTPVITQGTYSGTPAPTILGVLTLDGSAFSGELQPGDAGKTLTYTEQASNGVGNDATQVESVTVGSEPIYITADTGIILGALEDGDTLSSAVVWGSYSTTDGTINTPTTKEMSVNGGAFVAYNGATAVSYQDTYALRETVTDTGGNERPFSTGTQTVAGTSPTLTASDSLSGRTLTISVDSVNGAPAPSVSLTSLTLGGADVLGDHTGTGPWVYEVPSSGDLQSVNWTLEASNTEGVFPVSDVTFVAPDQSEPTADTAPVISNAKVGETPSATPGTYSGDPAPTVLGAFTLDGAAFDPPSELQPADEGKTLAYIETASNGVGNDATQTVNATVAGAQTYAESRFNNGETGLLLTPDADFYTSSDTSVPATVGAAVGRWDGPIGYASQGTTSKKPILRETGGIKHLETDLGDEMLTNAFTAQEGTLAIRVSAISDLSNIRYVFIGSESSDGRTSIVARDDGHNVQYFVKSNWDRSDVPTDVGVRKNFTITWEGGTARAYINGSLWRTNVGVPDSAQGFPIHLFSDQYISGTRCLAFAAMSLDRALSSTEVADLDVEWDTY